MTADKDEQILKEKITSDLFIQIDNPNISNLNIIQDNDAINRVVPPFLRLVLANRITRIISDEIKLIV